MTVRSSFASRYIHLMILRTVARTDYLSSTDYLRTGCSFQSRMLRRFRFGMICRFVTCLAMYEIVIHLTDHDRLHVHHEALSTLVVWCDSASWQLFFRGRASLYLRGGKTGDPGCSGNSGGCSGSSGIFRGCTGRSGIPGFVRGFWDPRSGCALFKPLFGFAISSASVCCSVICVALSLGHVSCVKAPFCLCAYVLFA
jgi:hypothetical protein